MDDHDGSAASALRTGSADGGMPAPLVGREEELQCIDRWLRQAAKGRGTTVFLQGFSGMGKTALIGEVLRRAAADPELRSFSLLKASCPPIVGPDSAYQPFSEILEQFCRLDQGRELGRRALEVFKEAGPDLLKLIPGIGGAVGAGAKAAAAAGERLLALDDTKHAGIAKPLLSQYVNTVAKLAEGLGPAAMVIDDAHNIDMSSCGVLSRLAEKILSLPVLIIVSYRPNELGETHPIRVLEDELVLRDTAHSVVLQRLDEAGIRNYLQTRFNSTLHPDLPKWLLHIGGGYPIFIVQYLSLLQQLGAIERIDAGYVLHGEIATDATGSWHLSGRISRLPVPSKVEEVLTERIRQLVKEDREILQIGSVQGEQFASPILARLLAKDELDVLSRLGAVVEQHHIIDQYQGPDDWSSEAGVYAFEHFLMQQAFYNKLQDRAQQLYHARIAEALAESLKEQLRPPRRVELEIARHYDAGKIPGRAAEYYYRAAQSSFDEGAFTEAVKLSQRALQNARKLPEGRAEHDRLRAEIILLLLMASEMRWRGRAELQGELPLEELVEEAETATRLTGDQALQAQAKYLRGRILIATRNLPEAVVSMKEALSLAQAARDPVVQFAIMPRIGNVLNAENLEAGLALLHQAYDLYQSELAGPDAGRTSTGLERHLHRLEGFLGVGEFDRGDYGKARRWLTAGVDGLERLNMRDDLLQMLNYLGQLYIASGLFEEAEAVLSEAINLLGKDSEPNAWRGYNRALLGKLYLEWERPEDAARPLCQGWEETKATWNLDLVGLVRNYYSELLMAHTYGGRNLAEAEQLLVATVDESERLGYDRSAIAALSLRARLALEQGRIEDAVRYSTRAVAGLEAKGVIPALRAEEVLYHHYRVLKATAREESEPRAYLQQAYDLLQRKADSFSHAEQRKAFLERVPLSRAILEAHWQNGRTLARGQHVREDD